MPELLWCQLRRDDVAVHGTAAEEIAIEEVVYTPHGLMYRVQHDGGRRFLPMSSVHPIHGQSRMQRFNPSTYESEDLGVSGGVNQDLAPTRDG